MKTSELPDDLRGGLAVAVDDSPSAREALRFAADLAQARSVPLHVVHVWNFVMGDAPDDTGDAPSVEGYQRQAEANLEAVVAEELGSRTGLDVRRLVLHGNTVPTLLAVGELASQLVLGNRGRGGFSGLLLGSTSAQLVGHAGCPVTVVRQGTTS